MKIGILSDLHLEYRQVFVQAILFEDPNVLPNLGFPVAGDPGVDLIILAGDLHPNVSVRRALRRTILRAFPGVSVIMTEGNHDFYGSTFPIEPTVTVDKIDGLTIAATTMWTILGAAEQITSRSFADFNHIEGTTIARWNQNHGASICALIEAEPDIVVTHHAPCSRSIGQAWIGNAINPFFHADVDFDLFPNTHLWVHGHVHDTFDYVIDRKAIPALRIICQPLGYPFERHRFGTMMKIVEI